MKQQDMFVVLVFLEVERAYQDDMRAALITYARMCIEREPGCRRYDVCLDPVDGTAFLLYQVYDDEAAYLHAPRVAALCRVPHSRRPLDAVAARADVRGGRAVEHRLSGGAIRITCRW